MESLPVPCHGQVVTPDGTRRAVVSRTRGFRRFLRQETLQKLHGCDVDLSEVPGRDRVARHDGRVLFDVVPRVRAAVAARTLHPRLRGRAGAEDALAYFALSSSNATPSTPASVSVPLPWDRSKPGSDGVAASASLV